MSHDQNQDRTTRTHVHVNSLIWGILCNLNYFHQDFSIRPYVGKDSELLLISSCSVICLHMCRGVVGGLVCVCMPSFCPEPEVFKLYLSGVLNVLILVRRTLWEQMILINCAQMEGMCLCSLYCPHTEKPNLTNPLITISFSHHPILPLSSSDIDADLSFLICTCCWCR